MTKFLYLDYSAFLIELLLLITLFLRTRKSSNKRGGFFLLLLVSIMSVVYDICAVWLDNRGSGAVILKYVLHAGYIILRNLIPLVFGTYIISVTDTWHLIKKKSLTSVIFFAPYCCVALLTAISPLTHWVFYIDTNANDAYTRGPFFFILYVSAVFYTVFCVFYAIKYYKVLTAERFIPLISIAPSLIVAVIVQFIYPTVLCEMVSTALCLLGIMLTIEKPEEKIDNITGLYKSNYFMSTLIQAGEVAKPLSVVLINITNHSALRSYLSFSNMDLLVQIISRRLTAVGVHLNIKPDIYDLENGLFAAIISDDEISYGARFATHVHDTLKHDYNINHLSVTSLCNVCLIKIPDDTSKIDEIRLVIKDFRKLKYTGDVIMASSLIKNNDYAVNINIEAILNQAIENNEFQVYYQPIYSNEEKRFNSAEALIRLITKEYGFIRPDLFIPMAEETGHIHQIGMIVLDKVCEFIASDDFKKLNLDYIEVNLSTVQCMDGDLVDKIMSVLDKHGVTPSQINLEVTETASAFLQSNMLSNIEKLHDLGFSFSLDDFGTGYSNMVRIASLPLHIVKLDKSFTWTENNPDLELILKNTINIVKKMEMKIVVEGVETEEMLKKFQDYKCEYIQGYYFSKPLPTHDFVKYIEDMKDSL